MMGGNRRNGIGSILSGLLSGLASYGQARKAQQQYQQDRSTQEEDRQWLHLQRQWAQEDRERTLAQDGEKKQDDSRHRLAGYLLQGAQFDPTHALDYLSRAGDVETGRSRMANSGERSRPPISLEQAQGIAHVPAFGQGVVPEKLAGPGLLGSLFEGIRPGPGPDELTLKRQLALEEARDAGRERLAREKDERSAQSRLTIARLAAGARAGTALDATRAKYAQNLINQNYPHEAAIALAEKSFPGPPTDFGKLFGELSAQGALAAPEQPGSGDPSGSPEQAGPPQTGLFRRIQGPPAFPQSGAPAEELFRLFQHGAPTTPPFAPEGTALPPGFRTKAQAGIDRSDAQAGLANERATDLGATRPGRIAGMDARTGLMTERATDLRERRPGRIALDQANAGAAQARAGRDQAMARWTDTRAPFEQRRQAYQEWKGHSDLLLRQYEAQLRDPAQKQEVTGIRDRIGRLEGQINRLQLVQDRPGLDAPGKAAIQEQITSLGGNLQDLHDQLEQAVNSTPNAPALPAAPGHSGGAPVLPPAGAVTTRDGTKRYLQPQVGAILNPARSFSSDKRQSRLGAVEKFVRVNGREPTAEEKNELYRLVESGRL
jgi:hypothetical protein